MDKEGDEDNEGESSDATPAASTDGEPFVFVAASGGRASSVVQLGVARHAELAPLLRGLLARAQMLF